MSQKPRKITKASTVFKLLREDILNGNLKPGEKLQMETLKQRYGIGLSPLREALCRLVTNGLVQVEEQCGFSVAPLSLTELYDLYKIRVHIESLALELSMQQGDDVWEGEVVASWHRYAKYLKAKNFKELDPGEWEQFHQTFRSALINGCQSPWLLKIRDILHEQALRYRSKCYNNSFQNKKMLQTIATQNECLVEAVLARNKTKALKLFRESWDTSIKIIAEALTKQERK